ncbi:hypothetical protein [Streptomyces zaomyceticus]|uniref:hypothetical protein n=1 Tax=Streptomyces zaomyceticus TaxID=68286 RepID=UPI002E102A76|nr:hypothetical protein OG237_06510 [Streptomyces zaomyceticus]
MTFGWLIGLTRARVFLIFTGLAWVVGLQVPVLTRLALVLLAAVAVAFDGFLDTQRSRAAAQTSTIPPQRTPA